MELKYFLETYNKIVIDRCMFMNDVEEIQITKMFLRTIEVKTIVLELLTELLLQYHSGR